MAAHPEKLLFTPNASGRVRVCLAYPSSYEVAMGNLGFHAVFRTLATLPGIYCERVFLPEAGTPCRSFESGRGPADFDVLAFSLSFESDYPNIVRMLDAAGIPARARDRDRSSRAWPLLMAGGPATFLNPEPVAPFFDLFLIGEGEGMIPEAFDVDAWEGCDRANILDRLGRIEGAYRPDAYEPESNKWSIINAAF